MNCYRLLDLDTLRDVDLKRKILGILSLLFLDDKDVLDQTRISIVHVELVDWIPTLLIQPIVKDNRYILNENLVLDNMIYGSGNQWILTNYFLAILRAFASGYISLANIFNFLPLVELFREIVQFLLVECAVFTVYVVLNLSQNIFNSVISSMTLLI